MRFTDEKVNEKLQESWKHIKPYINRESANSELHEMCKVCEAWCGTEHDYENCRDKPCFKFWLAYEYLHWTTSYENSEGM